MYVKKYIRLIVLVGEVLDIIITIIMMIQKYHNNTYLNDSYK